MSMNTITKFLDLKRSFKPTRRWWLGVGGVGVFLTMFVVLGINLIIVPGLPSIDVLKDVRFQVPLRVYTRDLKLVAEFGEKKREPMEYEEFPELMVKAVLAAEDSRFFEHTGVDYLGLLRAAF